MITIRLLQDALIKGQHVNAGETIPVADPLARFLIGINKAVAVVIDSPVVETAVAPIATEKAMQKRKRKSEVE